MDEVDIANHIGALQLKRALAAQAEKGGGDKAGLVSATTCVDCHGQIPAARRQLVPGCVRCLSCQQAVEEGRRGEKWIIERGSSG